MAPLNVGEKVLIVLEVEFVTGSTLESYYIIKCTLDFWMLLVNMIINKILMLKMNSCFTTRTQFTDE